MRKVILLLMALTMIASYTLTAQVAINNDGSSPDASAILDLKSSTQGLLLPRMTNEERDAISSPAAGLFIFNTDELAIQLFDGSYWIYLIPGSCVPQQPANITGNTYPGCNQTGLVYSIEEIEWASNYYWLVPPDASIVSGQGTTSIEINTGTQSGTVSVRAESGCGNSTFKDLDITIGITAPGSISGNDYPDCNATGESYSINPVNGATSYNWTVPPGATIASGQGTTNIDVNFSSTSGNVSVRAENSCGNSSYSELAITLFTCGNAKHDPRDGKLYNTVLIGSQCWFSENINVGTRINPEDEQQDNGVIEKFCYENEPDSCNKYGGIYVWFEVMQWDNIEGSQGICPEGWHVPTDTEWKDLEGFVDTQYPIGDPIWSTLGWRGLDVGNNLKSTSGWVSGGNGDDTYNFSTLAAGMYISPDGYNYVGETATFWTSTEYSQETPLRRSFLNTNADALRQTSDDPMYGRSLRCIKD